MIKYQICCNCVMDTSDPDIVFDDNGVCDHCIKYEREKGRWLRGHHGQKRLAELIDRIKFEGKGKDYDCILGLSGGLDSSYVALILRDYGLRVLAVHVDAGWNSNIAVSNIEKVVKYCEFDLITHVMDWSEIRDLQLAYLKAGVANQDVVQDHAFFSNLYSIAAKNKVKYVINGGNYATESVFPASWHHSAMDGLSIRDIHKQFGTMPLKNYKIMSVFDYFIYYPFIVGLKNVRPLNYVDYQKNMALERLVKSVEYTPYPRKHGESRFTRFFQNHYLPTKFGYDKRRPHLSSRILAGDITRDDAVLELTLPLYDDLELQQDISVISSKLGISTADLARHINAENRHYTDFANWDKSYHLIKKTQKIVEAHFGSNFAKYS